MSQNKIWAVEIKNTNEWVIIDNYLTASRELARIFLSVQKELGYKARIIKFERSEIINKKEEG